MATADLRNVSSVIRAVKEHHVFAAHLEMRGLIRDFEDIQQYLIQVPGDIKKRMVRPDVRLALEKALDPPDLRGVDKMTIDSLVNYTCNQMFNREEVLRNQIIEMAGRLNLLDKILI